YPKLIKEKEHKHRQELKRTKFLTQKQQKIFLEYIDKFKRCHYRNLYKFLLYTGLRISEAISLKWGQVDLKNKTLYVVDNHIRYYDEEGQMHELYNAPTKTLASNCVLPLTNEAIELLNIMRNMNSKAKKEDFLFLNTKGEPIKYGSFYQNLLNKVKRINKYLDYDDQLPRITSHFFRHTCAENLIENGVNLPAVQYMIRHAQLLTTANTYGHTGYNIAKEAIDKMEIIDKKNSLEENGTKLPQNRNIK
ncbi:MAG: site-specific integrase, partial [Clostridia bacterium]|nr:site-specific integrase [Clostridia bacterium]